MTWHQRVGALALCGAMAVLHTWPLATDLSGLSRMDNADGALNTWIVTWVAHQLPRQPFDVFNGPMFHPEPRTLAYSEPLLVPGAMAIPLRAADVPPVAIYNVLVIAGLALSAWSMWLVVAGWTGDAWAGALAGLAFAFNAHTLTRFAQIQGLHLQFLPVVLLALDRLSARARRRDGLLLGVGLVLVGMTSVYQLVFAGGAVVAGLAVRLGEWRHARASVGRALVLAGAVVALGLGPVLWQYWAVSREHGLVRGLDEVAYYSATWRDYLATGSRLHYGLWSAPFMQSPTSLFPGVTVAALAVLGVTHRARRLVWMLVAIATVGVVLSFGPAVPIYRWLYDALPIMRAIRVAARWGLLWLTGTAALAAFGLAIIRSRVPGLRGHMIATGLCVLVTIEALRAPMSFTPTPAIPPAYDVIARAPQAVVLEYPLYDPANANLNGPYLLAQLEHGKPIVAGYSGFATPGYARRVATLATFPSAEAHALIRELGVTHVVLNVAALRQAFSAELARLPDVPWLRRVYGDETTEIYEVTR